MHEPAAAPTKTLTLTPAQVLGESFHLLPLASRAIFQGGAEARAAASRAWPPGFSAHACRANVAGPAASLWLGPDEFLLIGPHNEWPTDGLSAALAGVPHSLVDVSHRQLGFELTGPNSVVLLSGGCPLDLDLAQFPIGMCTRTLFGKADIILWRKSIETFQVEVWRSFFDYTTELLAEIART